MLGRTLRSRMMVRGLCFAAAIAVAFTFGAVGAVQAADFVTWLLGPISGASEHEVAVEVSWHGRIMVLAWALVVPAAIVVARYFKITPRQSWPQRLDNPFWFLTHRRLSSVAAALSTLAVLILLLTQWGRFAPFRSFHSTLGWLITVLVWLQLLGSAFRGTHGGPVNPFTRQPKPPAEWPGDHFSMTKRRIFFEWTHKALGYLLIVLAVTAIQTGLIAVDAPVWMFIAIDGWWLMCVLALIWLQWRIRTIDTYQAIWGLDTSLPGYRHNPIGVGITRFTPENAANAPWQKHQKTSE